MKDKTYYLYILECADGTYYTGISNDVEKRIKKHNCRQGAKYTRGRVPVNLKYCEKHNSYKAAINREVEIKRWKREEKEKLFK